MLNKVWRSLANATTLLIVAYSIAMALLESAVVVYLRQLYYPEGFVFPLRAMPLQLAGVELARELATLVMIITVAWLAGNNRWTRFAWFLIIFAIWDLFYYVFLHVFIGWPTSLFDWDILFLIPVVWTGPVWSPLVLVMLMLLLGAALIHYNTKWVAPIQKWQWFFITSGSLICLGAFMYEFLLFALKFGPDPDAFDPNKWLTSFSPAYFPVLSFSVGVTLIAVGIVHYIRSNHISKKRIQNSQLI